MTDKKLTFEQFSEKWMDENTHLCQCHNTPFPPCSFCEGYFLGKAYDEYLNGIGEEK